MKSKWDIDERWLREKYINEKLSPAEIAIIVGCNHSVIRNRLKTYNIPMRSLNESYLNKRRGKYGTCKVCGKNYYKMPSAPLDTGVCSQKCINESRHINKDWLYDKYVVEQLSTRQIAALLGCSSHTVILRLKKYDIPIRTREEAIALYRNGEEVPCEVCGKIVYRKRNQLNKFDRFFCSWDCAKEYQATGSNNWRAPREYKEWRKRVIDRDNFCCVLCGNDTSIVAHHIIEAQMDQTLIYEPENGATLCKECHIMVHRQGSENFIKPLQAVTFVANPEYR